MSWGACLGTAAVAALAALWLVWRADPFVLSPSAWSPRGMPYGAWLEGLAATALLYAVGPVVVAIVAMRWTNAAMVRWYERRAGATRSG